MIYSWSLCFVLRGSWRARKGCRHSFHSPSVSRIGWRWSFHSGYRRLVEVQLPLRSRGEARSLQNSECSSACVLVSVMVFFTHRKGHSVCNPPFIDWWPGKFMPCTAHPWNSFSCRNLNSGFPGCRCTSFWLSAHRSESVYVDWWTIWIPHMYLGGAWLTAEGLRKTIGCLAGRK